MMSDTFFVEDVRLTEAEKKVDKNLSVPQGYITVKFSSRGRLNAPSELHFKDYTFDDALKLGMSNEGNVLENLVKVLNKSVFEEFDCSMLHEKEMEEVLINLFFNFWGKSIEKEYEPDEEDLDYLSKKDIEKYTKIIEKKEVPTVELTLEDIRTKDVPDAFKEPVSIKDNSGNSYKFILPRVKHLLVAKEYIDDKYASKESEFKKIERDLSFNEDAIAKNLSVKQRVIDRKQLNEYTQFTIDKANDFLMVRQAQLVAGMNDKTCSTMDEKLEVYKVIGIRVWKAFNRVLEETRFGIVDDIKVTSPITGKEVVRKFPFQFLELLPSNDVHNRDGYVVSFGN